MNYSNREQDCRVDFWKESGKWYATETITFADEDWAGTTFIFDAFKHALVRKLKGPDGTMQYAGMRATCLEPYHEHSHPISIIITECSSTWEG